MNRPIIWSHRASVDDQYGMILMARFMAEGGAETGRCFFACYLADPADRQFWLDDFQVHFPENRN